ncbi:hypothetical protein GBA52_021629 [Prunus armeniaca]|nr:hypothetical protein GBA52_021629 [Prunus armeniaca]
MVNIKVETAGSAMSAPPGTATTHSFCCFFHFDSYLYPFPKFIPLGQALPSGRLVVGIGRPRLHRDSQRLSHAVRSGGQGHVRPVVECSSSASCSSEKLGRVSTRWVLSDPEVGNGPVLVERKRP